MYNPLLQRIREELTPDLIEPPLITSHFQTSNNIELFVRTWISTMQSVKAIVICFHGLGGDGEYYVLLADQLCKFGIQIMVHDYEGHGNSSGRRGDMKHFERHYSNAKEFIERVCEQYPEIPIFLFGESMGGMVLINTIQRFGILSQVRGLILFSPAIKFRNDQIKPRDVFKNIFPFIISSIIPGKSTIVVRPDEHFAKSEAAQFMNPLHIEYDSTNKDHLEKVSVRLLLGLNRGMKEVYTNGASSIDKPIIIFLGEKDNAIDDLAVREFFTKMPSKKKKILEIKNAPHAMFTSKPFQSHWSDLINFIEENII